MIRPSPLILTELPKTSPLTPSETVNWATSFTVPDQPLDGSANTNAEPCPGAPVMCGAPATMMLPSALMATPWPSESSGHPSVSPPIPAEAMSSAFTVADTQPFDGLRNTYAFPCVESAKGEAPTIVEPSALMATDSPKASLFPGSDNANRLTKIEL